ncbi:MAG: class I SAM-dependent methyltransferase [Prosthecobacter sp.]
MSQPAPEMEAGPQSASFDHFASDYESALNQGLRFTGEGKDYFASGRVQWLRQRLASLQAAPPRQCLDFGCGTGTGSGPLVEEFHLESYLGHDPSAESIRVARLSATTDVARFESEVDAVPTGAFDLAFTNGVFHHIPPEFREEAVRNVWRALRPGGWFAFWENNRWNPLVHFLMSRVPFDHDAQMLFPFQARHLLRGAGFEIAGTDYLFVFPAMLKVLRPLERMLCKLPLGGQYLVLARKPAAAVTPPA